MRPFNPQEIKRSAIGASRTQRANIGLDTIREGGHITHFAQRPKAHKESGFWALITDYHITEVKKTSELGGDYWEEERFYVWEQVNLTSILQEGDPEDDDDMGFTHYKLIIEKIPLTDEKSLQVNFQRSIIDDHDFVHNVLLDAHGLIPKNSLVWVLPSDQVYIWHSKPEIGVQDHTITQVFRTTWSGIVGFELVDPDAESDQDTNALLKDYDGVYDLRPFKIEDLAGFLVRPRVDEPSKYIAGSTGTAFVQEDGRAHIVNVQELPTFIAGKLVDDLKTTDETFKINSVALVQHHDALSAEHIVDENEEVEVWNGRFKWEGDANGGVLAVWNNFNTRFEAVNVECPEEPT